MIRPACVLVLRHDSRLVLLFSRKLNQKKSSLLPQEHLDVFLSGNTQDSTEIAHYVTQMEAFCHSWQTINISPS